MIGFDFHVEDWRSYTVVSL